jgi:hypothetical protein
MVSPMLNPVFIAAERPEPAADAVVAGGRRAEDRDGGDALPIDIAMRPPPCRR